MLKYLIIGAGGVGGTLGAYLQRAGLSVSFLAHGKTLEALKKKGLTIVICTQNSGHIDYR